MKFLGLLFDTGPKGIDGEKETAFEMVYANSFNTLPLFAAAALVTGEPRHVINSEAWSSKITTLLMHT